MTVERPERTGTGITNHEIEGDSTCQNVNVNKYNVAGLPEQWTKCSGIHFVKNIAT